MVKTKQLVKINYKSSARSINSRLTFGQSINKLGISYWNENQIIVLPNYQIKGNQIIINLKFPTEESVSIRIQTKYDSILIKHSNEVNESVICNKEIQKAFTAIGQIIIIVELFVKEDEIQNYKSSYATSSLVNLIGKNTILTALH